MKGYQTDEGRGVVSFRCSLQRQCQHMKYLFLQNSFLCWNVW